MSRKSRQMEAAATTAARPTACQCECGTIRTPGMQHTKEDTGPSPKPLLSEWCNK